MLPIFRFKSETFTLSETVARSHLWPFFSPAGASRRSTSSVCQRFNSPLNLTHGGGRVCVGGGGRGSPFPLRPTRCISTRYRLSKHPEDTWTAFSTFKLLPLSSLFSPPSLVPSWNPVSYILCRRRKTTRSGKSILNEKMFRWGPPCGSVSPGEFVLCFWFIYHFCCVLAIYYFFFFGGSSKFHDSTTEKMCHTILPSSPTLSALCVNSSSDWDVFLRTGSNSRPLCCSSVSSRLLDTVLPQIWKKTNTSAPFQCSLFGRTTIWELQPFFVPLFQIIFKSI